MKQACWPPRDGGQQPSLLLQLSLRLLERQDKQPRDDAQALLSGLSNRRLQLLDDDAQFLRGIVVHLATRIHRSLPVSIVRPLHYALRNGSGPSRSAPGIAPFCEKA